MTTYGLTPGGYRPVENVHHVPEGHLVRFEGDAVRIVRPDGQVTAVVAAPTAEPPGQPLMPRRASSLRIEDILGQGDVVQTPPGLPDLHPEDLPRLRRDDVGAAGRLHLGHQPPIPLRRGAIGMTGGIAEKELLGAPGVVPATPINGWVCNTGWTNTTGSPISSLSTTWTVPPAPLTDVGQTVFLFNGIQNSTMIFQPVLQWGPSMAGGGSKWSVASWYADSPSGPNFYSSLVDVNPGDVITGVMTLTGQPNGQCDYQCEFTGLPTTVLPISQVQELTWANVTLEAYQVSDRNHYPNTSRTIMSSIDLRTAGGTAPALSWQRQNQAQICGEHVTVPTDGATGGVVDLWYVGEIGLGGWEARHGLDSAQYQAKFDDLVGNQGMELTCVAGYEENASDRYTAIFRKTDHDHDWLARHGLDATAHQQLFDTLPAEGWYPVLVNGYTVAGRDLYASIWHRTSQAPGWAARHGLSAQDYQAAFDQFTGQGFVPKWVSGYGDGGAARFAAVWHRDPLWTPRWAARHGLSAQDYQATFDDFVGRGLHPVVVGGYPDSGTDRYACIFTDDPTPALHCRHGLDATAYQQEFDTTPEQGFTPILTHAFKGVAGSTFSVTFASTG